ncbi:hypothetical protein HHI36_017888, partial [Cryptolaemus montrouzieri]
PNYYPNDINNFDDIIASGLNITCAGHIFPNLVKSFPEAKSYLTTHYRDSTKFNWPRAVAINKTYVALKARTEVKYLQSLYLDQNGHHLFEMLNTAVFRSLYGYCLLNGHPFIPKIRKYMNILKDHGFANRIIMEYDQFGDAEITRITKAINFKEFREIFLYFVLEFS